MLKSKALQIVMDLSEDDTMLVWQALNPTALPSLAENPDEMCAAVVGNATLQAQEPEQEESPNKRLAASDAIQETEAVSPKCLYFELDKYDVEDLGMGKGKGSSKLACNFLQEHAAQSQ